MSAQPADDVISAAVAAADTYQAAAIALGMQYPRLYAAAKRLGVRPKKLLAKPARSAPAPWTPPATRQPAPEPSPPRLGPWVAPSGPSDRVIGVRLDQQGRIRAEITDLRDHWCGWAIRDVTGAIVGKIGLRGGMRPGEAQRQAEAGADEALQALGWLPAGHQVPTEPCTQPAPMCSRAAPAAAQVTDPIVAMAERLLSAKRTERGGLGVELARLVVARAAETSTEGAA